MKQKTEQIIATQKRKFLRRNDEDYKADGDCAKWLGLMKTIISLFIQQSLLSF